MHPQVNVVQVLKRESSPREVPPLFILEFDQILNTKQEIYAALEPLFLEHYHPDGVPNDVKRVFDDDDEEGPLSRRRAMYASSRRSSVMSRHQLPTQQVFKYEPSPALYELIHRLFKFNPYVAKVRKERGDVLTAVSLEAFSTLVAQNILPPFPLTGKSRLPENHTAMAQKIPPTDEQPVLDPDKPHSSLEGDLSTEALTLRREKPGSKSADSGQEDLKEIVAEIALQLIHQSVRALQFPKWFLLQSAKQKSQLADIRQKIRYLSYRANFKDH